MRFELGHTIEYDTPLPVPITDVIASLRGAVAISEEIGPLLEIFYPGLEIESLKLNVRRIAQESPLTDGLMFAILASFQDSLVSDVHYVLNDIFKVHSDKHFDNIVSIIFLVLVFYAGKTSHEIAKKGLEKLRVRDQLDGLISEVATLLGKEEAEIKKLLDDRYEKFSIRRLASATHNLLLPSKNQNNAPVRVNRVLIPHEVIAEFPSEAQLAADEPKPFSEPIENVEIELHAQDRDRDKQGWAAVIPSLSPTRMGMQLYPPIVPTDIYTKQRIRGDVLVESRLNSKGELRPARVHLIRLRD